MATPVLADDFKKFLKLLNANHVEYLVIGGYAVGYHGYVRGTVDFDVWIRQTPENTANVVTALREFGFSDPELSPDSLLQELSVARMGVPPLRIEVITTISGVTFDECYPQRVMDTLDGVPVNVISLEHLKINKRASGRLQDLADLEKLP